MDLKTIVVNRRIKLCSFIFGTVFIVCLIAAIEVNHDRKGFDNGDGESDEQWNMAIFSKMAKTWYTSLVFNDFATDGSLVKATAVMAAERFSTSNNDTGTGGKLETMVTSDGSPVKATVVMAAERFSTSNNDTGTGGKLETMVTSVPGPSTIVQLTITCDDVVLGVYQEIHGQVNELGTSKPGKFSRRRWKYTNVYDVWEGSPMAVKCINYPSWHEKGLLASFSNGKVSGVNWKCHSRFKEGWMRKDFNDTKWSAARMIGKHGMAPWYNISGISESATWIWNTDKTSDDCYCRFSV